MSLKNRVRSAGRLCLAITKDSRAHYAGLFVAMLSYHVMYWDYTDPGVGRYTDVHWSKWFVLLSVASAGLAWFVAKKTHWIAGLAFLWAALSSLWVTLWRPGIYSNILPHAETFKEQLELRDCIYSSFSSMTLTASVSMIVLVVLVCAVPKETIRKLISVAGTFCVLNSLLVVWMILNDMPPLGFAGNPSMNGTIIAFTYPLLCFRPGSESFNPNTFQLPDWFRNSGVVWDLICLIAPPIAVVASDQSIPVVAWVIGTAVAVCATLIKERVSKRLIAFPLLLTVGVGIIGYMLNPDIFWDSSGRYSTWELFTTTWWKEMPVITGSGTGTFTGWGPHIQEALLGMKGGFMVYVHNDWLQILLEQGFVGLVLVVATYGVAVWRSVRHPFMLAALISMGAGALVNWPLHHAISASMVAVIMAAALRRVYDKTPEPRYQ